MKKIFFSTVLLAGVLASCSNDDFGAISNVETANGRTQINLTLNSDLASTRMGHQGNSLTYTTNDKLGAIIVDKGVKNANSTNVVDWAIVDSHVGNNKWNWVNNQFTTDGTTSIGAWLFYSRYNSDMTTSRNGVEYTFPQIQEYASDFKWIGNNNANFVVSPIYRIDGYEGENIDIPVYQTSIHSFVKLNLQLPNDVTEVQKIVLTAKDSNGDGVKFPTKGRIVNTKIVEAEGVANLLHNTESASYDVQYALPTISGNIKSDMEAEATSAYRNLINSSKGDKAVDLENITDTDLATKYTEITEAVGSNTADFLVLDCVDNHEDVAAKGVSIANGKFSSYMLIPAGIYQSIKLYVYTDEGIFVKEVAERDAALAIDDPNKITDTDKKNILLRRHTRVNLANIVEKASDVEDAAIKIESADKEDANTVATELGGVIITKTADLIAAIKGAQDKEITFKVVNQDAQNLGSDEAIPAHSTLINKAVADAVLEKWSDARTSVNLIFDNSKMEIVGESDAYDLVGMTFKQGCELTSGNVNVAENVYFGADEKAFVVASNATANFTAGTSEAPATYAFTSATSTVKNAGTVNFEGYATMNRIENNDGATVNVNKVLNVAQLKNTETITVKEGSGELTITNALTNDVQASIENNNNLVISATTANNYGTITNNKSVVVRGNLANKAEAMIVNAQNATFVAQVGSTVKNEMYAEFDNSGELYCIIEGSNKGTIENIGTIYAREGALTYITTNMEGDWTTSTNFTEDNMDDTTIGRIILSDRASNMSVSTADKQGSIEYEVTGNMTEWIPEEGDKFNKLIFTNNESTLSDPVDLTQLASVASAGITKVIAVEVKGSKNSVRFANNQALKELVIHGNTNVLGQNVQTAILRVLLGAKMTVPTNNVFGVYEFNGSGTGNGVKSTCLVINNHSTILVGGRFYTSLSNTVTENNGEFASGAGSEAYIFSTTTNWVKPLN